MAIGDRLKTVLRYILQRLFGGIGTIAVAVSALVVLPFSPIVLSAEQAIGSITAARGMVVMRRPGSGGPAAVKKGDSFRIGDIIDTGDASTAQITLNDDSFMNLGPHSSVRVNQYSFDIRTDRRTAVVRLLKGKARIVIYQIRSRESLFRVETGNALATAETIADFVVMVNRNHSEVTALESSLSVRNSFNYVVGEVRLGVNQRSIIQDKVPPSSPTVISSQERRNCLKELK